MGVLMRMAEIGVGKQLSLVESPLEGTRGVGNTVGSRRSFGHARLLHPFPPAPSGQAVWNQSMLRQLAELPLVVSKTRPLCSFFFRFHAACLLGAW